MFRFLIIAAFALGSSFSVSAVSAESFSAKIHYAGLLHHDKQTLAYKSLTETQDVPASLGQVFGIYYELSGGGTSSGIGIKEVIRSATGSELVRNTQTFGEGKILAFRFDEESELLEGSWTFEVWLGKERLLVQSFDVSKSHTGFSGKGNGVITSFCDTDIKTGSVIPIKTCAPKLARQ